MKKALSLCMMYVVLAASIGCNANQLAADIADLESKIPQIAVLATAVLSLTDPEIVPLVQPFSAALASAGDTVQSLLKQCSAAGCNATTLAGINAAVQVGITNINNITALVKVKNPLLSAKIDAWASVAGLIFNDAAAFVANHGTPAAIASLPNMFGWHIAGVELIAIDGKKLSPATITTVKKSGWSARKLAKRYNDTMKDNPKAQIPVPKAHFMGVPVPFTGKK